MTLSVIDGIRALPRANDEVVELLESWLARAKKGEVQSFAIAAECAFDNEEGTGTATQYMLGTGDVSALVCALERVKLRLLLDDEGEC